MAFNFLGQEVKSEAARRVTASITAQNTFTPWVLIQNIEFTTVITGLTGTGSTVTLQRSFDTTPTVKTNIEDIESYTANPNPQRLGRDPSFGAFYRIGVKTGGYVAGTIAVSLSS